MESYATEAPEIASDPAKLEKDSGFRSLEAESATQDRVDRHVVDFDGPDDPENPLNWSNTRKWCLVGLISAMTLVTYAPSLPSVTLSLTHQSQEPCNSHVRTRGPTNIAGILFQQSTLSDTPRVHLGARRSIRTPVHRALI